MQRSWRGAKNVFGDRKRPGTISLEYLKNVRQIFVLFVDVFQWVSRKSRMVRNLQGRWYSPYKYLSDTIEKVFSKLALETSNKFTYKFLQLAMYITAICVLFLIQEYYCFFVKQFLDCISAQAPQKAITRPQLKKRLLLNLLWAHPIANLQAPVLQAGRPPLGQFNPNHRAGTPRITSKTNNNVKFKDELKTPYWWSKEWIFDG